MLWWYGHTTGSDLMSAAATLGFLLNLFNMVPVPPFDGGVAAGAIHPYVWFVGIFGLTLADAALPERDPVPLPRHRRSGRPTGC